MKDFNQQRGLVSKVLATSVRVTMMSGPAVGLAKTFPYKSLSKVVHKGMERTAALCSEDEHASKKSSACTCKFA